MQAHVGAEALLDLEANALDSTALEESRKRIKSTTAQVLSDIALQSADNGAAGRAPTTPSGDDVDVASDEPSDVAPPKRLWSNVASGSAAEGGVGKGRGGAEGGGKDGQWSDMGDGQPVTIAVHHHVRWECTKEYEAWVSEIHVAMRKYAGFLSMRTLPSHEGDVDQTVEGVIFRFDSLATAQPWLLSKDREVTLTLPPQPGPEKIGR